MSIAVEDWDDLAEARRRRDERAALFYTPPVARERRERGRRPTVEVATRAHRGARHRRLSRRGRLRRDLQNLKLPAYIAGDEHLAWAAGRLTGVVELVGVAFFVSIVLLLAAYVLREWHRDRTALICLAGALPLPVTIISLLHVGSAGLLDGRFFLRARPSAAAA